MKNRDHQPPGSQTKKAINQVNEINVYLQKMYDM